MQRAEGSLDRLSAASSGTSGGISPREGWPGSCWRRPGKDWTWHGLGFPQTASQTSAPERSWLGFLTGVTHRGPILPSAHSSLKFLFFKGVSLPLKANISLPEKERTFIYWDKMIFKLICINFGSRIFFFCPCFFPGKTEVIGEQAMPCLVLIIWRT